MSRLLSAVFENDVAKIAALLERDPRRIGDQDAFCQAIGWGHKEAAIFLMERGADLDARDRNGNTPLKMACHCDDSVLFHELIRRGSKLRDASDLAGTAAWAGHVDILRFLHEAGVDMNEGRPIKGAVGCGAIDVVRYLLSLGVNTSFIDASRPLKQWKGSVATRETMEEIRGLIADHNAALDTKQGCDGV